ncbi:adenylyltransferase/cytidyltransferase family protein [Patescibacteria group bacterium]|nr:adenylyltransferase/cytidyltransferase family protein [Patescibacteria group bacterium]
MGTITTLTKLQKTLRPHTATLVGGVFDLFHVGHLRYLRKSSELGRPLVVIVQADKTVRIRKGFNRPIVSERRRAEIVAALGFVDFVLILDKPSHYEKYLEIIKPRYYVFSKETMTYRRYRAYLINKKFPNIKVVFPEKSAYRSRTSLLIKQILGQRDYSKIKNPIVRHLYFLADHSKASIGKISALITSQGKVVAESDNIESKDIHAECIVIKKAKQKGVDLKRAKLYILISPCILCSQEILKSKIAEVYYLHPYGDDDGIKLLRKHGIKVKKLKKNLKLLKSTAKPHYCTRIT